jgi:hypothetical protein
LARPNPLSASAHAEGVHHELRGVVLPTSLAMRLRVANMVDSSNEPVCSGLP